MGNVNGAVSGLRNGHRGALEQSILSDISPENYETAPSCRFEKRL